MNKSIVRWMSHATVINNPTNEGLKSRLGMDHINETVKTDRLH